MNEQEEKVVKEGDQVKRMHHGFQVVPGEKYHKTNGGGQGVGGVFTLGAN